SRPSTICAAPASSGSNSPEFWWSARWLRRSSGHARGRLEFIYDATDLRRNMATKRIVTATINGRETAFLCEPRQTLLEVLRDVLDMTGTKEGCSNGNCGACTVLLNGRPVVSCLVLAVECAGGAIETVEGLAEAERLAPLQQAFLENAALQCGICTPGFIVAATALLRTNPR